VINGLFAGSFVQGSQAAIVRLQRNSARYFQRPDAPQVHLDPTRTSLSDWDAQLNLNKTSGDLTFNASLWGERRDLPQRIAPVPQLLAGFRHVGVSSIVSRRSSDARRTISPPAARVEDRNGC